MPVARPPGRRRLPTRRELARSDADRAEQLKEAARFATPERAAQALEALFFAAEKPLDFPALEETTQFSQEAAADGGGRAAEAVWRRRGRGDLVDWRAAGSFEPRRQVGAYVRRHAAGEAGAAHARAARDAGHRRLSPADHAAGDRRDPRRRLGRHAQDAARALAGPHPRQEGGAGPPAALRHDQGVPRVLQPARPEGAADAARVPRAVRGEPRKIVEEETRPPPVAGLSDLPAIPRSPSG